MLTKDTPTQEDFKPIPRELLATHPGLEFLQSTPEFQERYVGNEMGKDSEVAPLHGEDHPKRDVEGDGLEVELRRVVLHNYSLLSLFFLPYPRREPHHHRCV